MTTTYAVDRVNRLELEIAQQKVTIRRLEESLAASTVKCPVCGTRCER